VLVGDAYAVNGRSVKSIHFARCIGAFEGGGIRGAAHAGAFLGCIASGINIEATIGSSAGSMIAVLIAAGLTPQQIIEEMSIDLSSLLVPVEADGLLPGAMVRLSRILGRTAQTIVRAHYGLGLYKSAPLRVWMNRVLRKYLPSSSDPVVFQDLHKPVAVMATDVLGRKPKVWSRERDPAVPVAYAVEASCAIPFFFQPVGGEATMLVDGGILSNLPVFLVPYLQLPTKLPVLCFRLKSDSRHEPIPPERWAFDGSRTYRGVGNRRDGSPTQYGRIAPDCSDLHRERRYNRFSHLFGASGLFDHGGRNRRPQLREPGAITGDHQ